MLKSLRPQTVNSLHLVTAKSAMDKFSGKMEARNITVWKQKMVEASKIWNY